MMADPTVIEYENAIAREALKEALEGDYQCMNQDVKVKWLNDLATAKQAKSKLKADFLEDGASGYCCLGRLCVVAGGAFQPVEDERFDELHEQGCEDEDCDGCSEPTCNIRPLWPNGTLMSHDNEGIDEAVMVWAGLATEAVDTLMDLNDKSDDFSYVMEFIREKL
jgi:hypothetical protein